MRTSTEHWGRRCILQSCFLIGLPHTLKTIILMTSPRAHFLALHRRHTPSNIAWAANDSGAGPGRSKVKVLVVEDNIMLALNVEDHLTHDGFDVVGMATSGAEALELAGRLQPDVVIMDIRLPGGDDGIDTAIALRRKFGISTIFASAHSAPDMRHRAEGAQAVGWLTKPYAMTDVSDAIRAAVTRKSSN